MRRFAHEGARARGVFGISASAAASLSIIPWKLRQPGVPRNVWSSLAGLLRFDAIKALHAIRVPVRHGQKSAGPGHRGESLPQAGVQGIAPLRLIHSTLHALKGE